MGSLFDALRGKSNLYGFWTYTKDAAEMKVQHQMVSRFAAGMEELSELGFGWTGLRLPALVFGSTFEVFPRNQRLPTARPLPRKRPFGLRPGVEVNGRVDGALKLGFKSRGFYGFGTRTFTGCWDT